VVEGSLCPCWSWADAPELYSGKHKTTGHTHQFVCDLSGNLLRISDPLAGNTHDAKAIHETGLSELLGDDNTIGDKASRFPDTLRDRNLREPRRALKRALRC
jgi:YD repeat-containing protein